MGGSYLYVDSNKIELIYMKRKWWLLQVGTTVKGKNKELLIKEICCSWPLSPKVITEKPYYLQ